CARIMEEQGTEEPTGQAKITPAYDLPARFVIHTVGPIAAGHPTARHRLELASSYRSCLDLAQEAGLANIVFCCISTGVFGFPQEEAARIAVDTVRDWLDVTGSGMTVVFNVFLESDERIYRSILMR
ncbi:MAG: macro domain-containing protein, partial [Atopobiaceae bacterium]|nr:macro domain-containing protein [Atopobiaceae bacterium]